MSYVFVMDTNKKPLNPVHPGEARSLLNTGKAAVLKRYPFTIILKGAVETPQVRPLRVKLDPGSRTTGIAVVNDATGKVLFAAELSHRGQAIRDALRERRAIRRNRRARHTRYRKPRFHNRRRPNGWMAPSLESRVYNVVTWVKRLMRLCPIEAISMELVRFDMQAMHHPDTLGCQYQQGTLAGYELREYLLVQWERQCAYCAKENVPLRIEHIVPRAKGGSDRVSNLALACESCNQTKGTQDITVFLAKKPDLLQRILAQARTPLQDAAAVNSTRWALHERLQELGLPVECGSGGRTKCNTATGHARRQLCVTDKYGFPKQHKQRHQTFLGYRTGDVVKATTPNMTITGRIAIRHRPSFRVGKVDIHPKYMRRVHRANGYTYQKGVLTLHLHACKGRGTRAMNF